MLSIPTSFLPCNFCPSLTEKNTSFTLEGAKECRFTKMNATDLNSSMYFSNISSTRLGTSKTSVATFINVLKPEHDIWSSVLSLVLKFGLSRLSKVY